MSNTPVRIRLAERGDEAVLGALFHASDVHFWGPAAASREAMAEHVRDSVLGAPTCETALAECGGAPTGFATFAILYPAPGPAGQLFLKNLFILANARGRGVGRAFMSFLARLAVDRGCSRFDWTAETDNPAALAFYDRLGAQRVEEKVYYRFDGEALKALAASG